MTEVPRYTLNWNQNILEPLKPWWKPVAKDALATPQHKVQSVVHVPAEPAPAEVAYCGRGRGQTISEKLKAIAAMGPAASSQYTGEDDPPKKLASKKPTFPSREEQAAQRRREERKDWVMNHQQKSVGECYMSIKRQASWYTQEVGALWFFEPEGKETDLACMVLTIADWAVEYNELSTHPVPEIPPELQVPYSGSRQARGQFPLSPTLEESSSTDVLIQCQARWTYLCVILQFFKDETAIQEGALFGRRTCRPSTLVLHIMDRVNPGLPEHFWVEWPSIVGSTPWLAARDHMTNEELDRFYSKPPPDVVSDLEVTTEAIYTQSCEESAQWRVATNPFPHHELRSKPGTYRGHHLSPSKLCQVCCHNLCRLLIWRSAQISLFRMVTGL